MKVKQCKQKVHFIAASTLYIYNYLGSKEVLKSITFTVDNKIYSAQMDKEEYSS